MMLQQLHRFVACRDLHLGLDHVPEFELWFATPATTPFFAEVVLLLDDVATFVETDNEVFFAEATELVVLVALLDEFFVVSELVVAVAFLLDATDELFLLLDLTADELFTLLELFLLLATDELFTLLELFLLLATDELFTLLELFLLLDLTADELFTLLELFLLLDLTADELFTLLDLIADELFTLDCTELFVLAIDELSLPILKLIAMLAVLVVKPTMFCHGF